MTHQPIIRRIVATPAGAVALTWQEHDTEPHAVSAWDADGHLHYHDTWATADRRHAARAFTDQHELLLRLTRNPHPNTTEGQT